MTQTIGAKILEWPLLRCRCCDLYLDATARNDICVTCFRNLNIDGSMFWCSYHRRRVA